MIVIVIMIAIAIVIVDDSHSQSSCSVIWSYMIMSYIGFCLSALQALNVNDARFIRKKFVAR